MITQVIKVPDLVTYFRFQWGPRFYANQPQKWYVDWNQ